MKLFRYLDDITLVTPPTVANTAFEILNKVLTNDGMLLNEEKCVAFTTDGSRPQDGITAKLWDSAEDHGGFTVCGFPSTYGNPSEESPLAFPI